MELSPVVEALIGEFESRPATEGEASQLSVSRTVSALAVLYEKARNAVEFRAEHLVRRAAIERIVKRLILINSGSPSLAENLIVELLWARYIDSSLISNEKIAKIQYIIEKYLSLKHTIFSTGNLYKTITWDRVIGVASSEIEETIVSPRLRDALTNFFYQAVRPRIHLMNTSTEFINMQSFIAIERAYAQSDDSLTTFHLLKIIFPDWLLLHGNELTQNVTEQFVSTLTTIHGGLSDPLGEPLSRFVRKLVPPFLIIRDYFTENKSLARQTIEDPIIFEQKLAELTNMRYHEIGAKVRRAVVRSIIYIFLTKMIFALALEAPFDIFISKRVSYIPLAINTVFPPLLLFLVAGLFTVPGTENTRKLVDRVKKIIYSFDEYTKETDEFTPKTRVRRPVLTAIFSLFYIGTFLLSFGAISYILTALHFNLASQTIFVFFVTLVSFFAYRIRQSAKEYEIEQRQGILEPIVDFFFLPILRAGHFLSREIAKINIFIFLFDFILEAPLKVILEVIEEWIRYIRIKKEEII